MEKMKADNVYFWIGFFTGMIFATILGYALTKIFTAC
jgi:hypothetical protein